MRGCTIGTGGRCRSGDVPGPRHSPTVRGDPPGRAVPGRSVTNGALKKPGGYGSTGRDRPVGQIPHPGVHGRDVRLDEGLAVHAAPRPRRRVALAPPGRAGSGARHPARDDPDLAARRRLLPRRGEGHPPPHRAERALVLDERDPAGGRALPRLTAGVHRRARRRLRARPRLQSSPARRSSSRSTSPSSASPR